MAARDLNCLPRAPSESEESLSATSTNTQRAMSSNSRQDMQWRSAMRAMGRSVRTMSDTSALCRTGCLAAMPDAPFPSAAGTTAASNRGRPLLFVTALYTTSADCESGAITGFSQVIRSQNIFGIYFPSPTQGQVARLGGDTREPSAHRAEAGEIEAALFSDVGVCVQRHIGDGVRFAHEERTRRQVFFHHRQRLVTALGFLRKRRLVRILKKMSDEASRGDIGLVAILLPE